MYIVKLKKQYLHISISAFLIGSWVGIFVFGIRFIKIYFVVNTSSSIDVMKISVLNFELSGSAEIVSFQYGLTSGLFEKRINNAGSEK